MRKARSGQPEVEFPGDDGEERPLVRRGDRKASINE